VPALAPIFLFVQILGVVAHVRLGLGRWPTPMIDNYQTPLFHLQAIVTFATALYAIMAAPAVFVGVFYPRKARVSRRVHFTQFAVHVTGWLLIWGFWKWDPQRFVTWFMD
jgi:hypothetical protein